MKICSQCGDKFISGMMNLQICKTECLLSFYEEQLKLLTISNALIGKNENIKEIIKNRYKENK